MMRAKVAMLVVPVCIVLAITCGNVIIQHRSIKHVSFEAYLYDQSLMKRHKALCAGALAFSTRCHNVNELVAQFDDLQSIYRDRKISYDELKFLLKIQGRHALRKELWKELKAIQLVMENDAKKKHSER